MGDPFARAVTSTARSSPTLFAGVGVDYTNRRRNKLAGHVLRSSLDAGGVLLLDLATNENLGNCPKYITQRSLLPFARDLRQPPLAGGSTLGAESVRCVSACSTVYIATRHVTEDVRTADMGVNHRGGVPGFVRYYEADGQGFLVLPDYSGNRFFQSLGNVQTDRFAGLCFPDFRTGNVLHVTGRAENVFGDEAEHIMPRQRVLTRVSIVTSVLCPQALQLQLIGEERLSPYNPPMRLLAFETSHVVEPVPTGLTARLVRVEVRSHSIKTFCFVLSAPAPPFRPGGFAVFDFSGHIHHEYQHMCNSDPASLNDDLIRTWTVSSVSEDRLCISVTVKLAGRVSRFLCCSKHV
jgi:hypothetical protein